MTYESHSFASTSSSAPESVWTVAPRASVVDFYALPHRGLRWTLCRLLNQAGSTDFRQVVQVEQLEQNMLTTFELLEGHLHHEEQSVHPALIRVAPRLVQIVDEEHLEHRHHMTELKRLVERCRSRPEAGRALYLCLSRFIVENFTHMELEETSLQRALDDHHDEQTLQRMHDELIASISPEDMVAFLGVMLPSMSGRERIEFLAGPRAGMPPEVFFGLVSQSSIQMPPEDRAELIKWAQMPA